MVQLSGIIATIACVSLATARPHSACAAGVSANSSSATPKAIYFISNTADNSIIALKVAQNGILSDGSITATGGAGLSGISAADGKAAAPDSLFSQGVVKIAGNVSLPLHLLQRQVQH